MIEILEAILEYFSDITVSPELFVVLIVFCFTLSLDFVGNFIDTISNFFKDFKKF